MEKFKAGDKIEILDRGEWIGPFIVTNKVGRTPDHLVCTGPFGVIFEQYNDAPYNTRKVN